MTGCVRAAVRCGTCGKLTKGKTAAFDWPPGAAADALPLALIDALGGITGERMKDWKCRNCGLPILSAGAKIFLLYEEDSCR